MTPPEQITDAEIAREMAEADGWRVVKDGDRFLLFEPNAEDYIFSVTCNEEKIDKFLYENFQTRYPRSLDAAVGWLGRRGFKWDRESATNGFSPWVWVGLDNFGDGHMCNESPTCPTARALCNAGLAAWRAQQQAKEAKG